MKYRFIFLSLLVVLFLWLVGAFLLVAPARAGATFVVDRTDDDVAAIACTSASNDCSLRGAIIAANALLGDDAIVLPSGIYTLTLSGAGEDNAATGDLDLRDNVTLIGAGADSTIVSGNDLDRVFHVLTATVQFIGITIRNGSATSSGGGLFNEGGNVTLTSSAVTSNTTSAGPSIGGGGVYNTALGTLTLVNTAVLSNTTTNTTTGANAHGGGVYSAGTLTMINTTLSGNRATRSGGGLYNAGVATLSNVTITHNTADSNADGSGDAGGIRTTGAGATVAIRNSLVAGNYDLSTTIVNPDCNGVLTSQGHNLLGINTGCTFTSMAGDQVGTATSPLDPRLGPLQNNGGPTLTHAFLPGSPAMDAGDNVTCATTDQRGSVRPMDGDGNGSAVCDIGAYELRVFEVNSPADKTDANLADGICQTLTMGECTLRAAIQQANVISGIDIIQLAPAIYTLSLAGADEDFAATGDLDILDNLQILGAGPVNTIIDGGALDRVFHVISPTVTVLISGVTIRNGRAAGPLDPNLGSGGGISNNGYLFLTDSTLISNTADFGGGGIANNGVLALSRGTVLSNTAPMTMTPLSGVGGGVANAGLLNVTDSLISSNTAGSDGGGFVNSGVLTVTATTIRGNAAGDDGGGLRNFGIMSLVNSSVISNAAVSYGGGLDNGSNNNLITGTLAITSSTFSGNIGGREGGGVSNELGAAALTNSTFSGNSAAGSGGGVSNNISSTLSLNNTTLANNVADSDINTTGDGGGLFNKAGGTVNFKNTLIAGNVDNSSSNKDPDCSGVLNSQDYNLIQNVTVNCTFSGTPTHDQTGVDPNLGPLQDNVGPTFTHALLSGSPAIDAGDNAACEATDQRGGARPVDGNNDGTATCDIGAYEFGAAVYRVYLPIIERGP